MTAPQGLNAAYLLPNFQPIPPAEQKQQGITTWLPQEAILRKPPRSEGTIVFEISKTRALFQHSQNVLDQDIDQLRKVYGFHAADSVAIFLANHRSVPSVLLAAVPHLREYFGPQAIFNLEVSTDEDDSQTLYAVAVWHNTVQSAAAALDEFEENWWLDHMTPKTTDLAFTYKLA